MGNPLPTVLVVDDEPRSLETLRRTLEEEFDVLTAENAEQAWGLLEQEWVQVVLCDQRMPGESGVDFLGRVRERWPEVIRIIISGYTDAGDLVEAINRAGVYQYISKPWHPDKLLLKLRNAVALFQLQRQNAPPDAEAVLCDNGRGYSWCKAPRYQGQALEVGALARQLVDGQPLIRDLVAATGGNVRSRIVARLLELARVIPAMQGWIEALRPGEPFCRHGELPEEGQGMGLVEAARGSLGHWLQVRHGRILNYQIVAPTTWNFSPRDGDETPGALEQALVGTPVDEAGGDSLAIQHVVRSFDPCMVCTVH